MYKGYWLTNMEVKMDIENVPIIKIDLDNIRRQIKTSLGVSNNELGTMIDDALKEAISSYDFDSKVINIVHEIITEEIDEFFKNGPGRIVVKKTIEETLTAAN